MNEELLNKAVKASSRLEDFISILSDAFPELGLTCTGSIYLNSLEIAIDEKIAREILDKEEFKDFKEKGIGRL